MEEKVVKMDEFKKEAAKRERKAAVEKKLDEIAKWYKENENFVNFTVPFAAGILFGLFKKLKAAGKDYYKDTHYYDHSAGHWWELRRRLTNKEWQHFQIRKQNGESTLEIFQSMGVLK